MEVTFLVPSLSAVRHRARLVHVDETASATSRMVECLAEGSRSRPRAQARLLRGRERRDQGRRARSAVPESALQPTERGWIAYVVVDGKAVRGCVTARPPHERRARRGARRASPRARRWSRRAPTCSARARPSHAAAAPRTPGTASRSEAPPPRPPTSAPAPALRRRPRRPRRERREVRLTDASIRKPVFAWMLMAAADRLRRGGGSRIGISQIPDVDFPHHHRRADLGGRRARGDRERRRRVVEEALMQVEGDRRHHLHLAAGRGHRHGRARPPRDVDLALQDVQTKVAQAQRAAARRTIDPPVVSKTNPEDQPIMWVGLSGPLPAAGARRLSRATACRSSCRRSRASARSAGRLPRAQRAHLGRRRAARRAGRHRRRTSSPRCSASTWSCPAGRLETAGREVNVRVSARRSTSRRFARHRRSAERDGAAVYLRRRGARRGRLRGRAP